MRSGEPLCYVSANPVYYLSAKGRVNMDFHLAQSPHPGICQTVAALLLRVSPLYAGAGVTLLLPLVSPSGDRAKQTVVPFGMKIKASSVGR